jgi:hypothetical protein
VFNCRDCLASVLQGASFFVFSPLAEEPPLIPLILSENLFLAS